MANTLRGSLPFCEELISKCRAKKLAERAKKLAELAKKLAELPKELRKSILPYVMPGRELVIIVSILGLFTEHTEYLKYQLIGPNAKKVVIALQTYIEIYRIKRKHDKECKDASNEFFNLKHKNQTIYLAEFKKHYEQEIYKKNRDLRDRESDLKHELIKLIYEGYVYVNGVLRLYSELTAEEYENEPEDGYPIYTVFHDC